MSPPKSRRQRLVAGTAALVALGLMAACSSTTDAGTAAKPIAKKDIVLVASVINTTNPYFASNIEGAQALGKKLGLPVEIVDSEGSSQKEISKIQAILAQGKKVVLFVNTVASSDVPPIISACKQAGAYCTIWWNKPDDYEPWDQGNNFVAFQKHGGVDSGRCTAKTLAEAIEPNNAVQAGPYVTVHSYQFTADVAAVGEHGRGFRRVKFVFDTSDGTPKIVYRQDLTHLGWALGNQTRQQLLALQLVS